MKKKLLFLFPCLVTALSFTDVQAQDYEHLTVTSGFSADVIANGAGNANASTTLAVDNANYNFMSNDFLPPAAVTSPAYALPATGLISSNATTGLTYQLAPLSGNNSLRIATASGTGTLEVSNAMSATKLYVLATSGSGSTTNTITVNFTDDTFQTFTAQVIPDWFNSTVLPVATSGFGRVLRTTNAIENPAGNPRLYQLELLISPENQVKVVESVQFTKTSTAEGVLNVFAITAEVLSECPPPGNLMAESTASGATIGWDAAVIEPSQGYDYYYSDESTAPNEDTEPEGNVSSDETSVTLNDLDTGIQYFFWVRSNCGDDAGSWQMVVFTTGQMDTVYEEGDISSDYFDEQFGTNPVTITDENACPGEMSVVVPAGYQIASVATSYSISSTNNAYQSEQRSLLVCMTNDETEAAITLGPGVSAGGVVPYTRTGLDIADGLTGTVDFELRVWRSWGNSATFDVDCGVQYAKVVDGTWTITITYEPLEGGCDLEAPLAADQDFCGVTTVGDLEAEGVEGAAFHWYLTEDGEDELADAYEVEPGTYYVSQSVGDCESAREEVEVNVTITEVPEPAMVIIVCEGITVFDLDAGAMEGATVNWYTEEEGGEPLEDVEAEPGTYYVSQTLNGCESERVEVELMPLPPAEPGLDNEICGGTTIADMQPEEIPGLFISFYTSSEGGEPLPEDTVLETEIYYITINTTECESERVEAGFIVINTDTPEPTPNQTICGDSATVIQLDPGVEGEAAIVWYDEDDNVLGPEDILVNGATYYVGTTSELCGNSETVPVTVTVNPVPDNPLGDDEQEFTEGETIEDLEVDFIEGAVIQWFMLDEDVWVEVNATDALIDDAVYYVTQTMDGCTSNYLTITVDQILGTDTFDRANLSVYPNPASEMINVSYNGLLDRLVINNLLGQEVMTQDATGTSAELNLSRLSQGTYLLQVYAADGSFATVKIVKR